MNRVLACSVATSLIAFALVAAGPAEAQATSPRTPPPVNAQSQQAQNEPVDPALQPTLENLRTALAALAQADRELLPSEGSSTLRGADEATLDRRARARAKVVAGLDTLLALGARGRSAIRSLANDWPGIDLVRRYEVRAAFEASDAADALQLVNRMAITASRDTQLLAWRASALDTLGRPAEALRARQARYELAPEDAGAWTLLLRAHERAGSLPALRQSLSRLRLIYPDSRSVREHEIEVLHRLGRGEEAARIAADTTGGPP